MSDQLKMSAGKCDRCGAEAPTFEREGATLCPACSLKDFTYDLAEKHLEEVFDAALMPWWERWAEMGLSVQELGSITRDVADVFAESFVKPR